MSRSGYSDDYENIGLWRGAVKRATEGRRGQDLLKRLLAALDAMPEKRLITDAIKDEHGGVCALGALDPTVDEYDAEYLAEHFGVARALAAEIVYENDEHGPRYEAYVEADRNGVDRTLWRRVEETPEERWARMRAWVAKQIRRDEA